MPPLRRAWKHLLEAYPVFLLHKTGVDGSVVSVLQWISFLQEEWLIVFDNADLPPLEVLERFMVIEVIF